MFIKNLAYLSDWHLCSIHMDGWPGPTAEHCNIKHECCWMEFFRKHKVKCEILGHARSPFQQLREPKERAIVGPFPVSGFGHGEI